MSDDFWHLKHLDENSPPIAEAAHWLHEHGMHDAATRTEEAHALLKRAEAVRAELEAVWRAVNKATRHKISPSDVVEDVERWRESHKVPPDAVAVSVRLHALDGEARELAAKIEALRVETASR